MLRQKHGVLLSILANATVVTQSHTIFMAVAAERSRTIKLGTGVVSVSYHNPLWVAERIV